MPLWKQKNENNKRKKNSDSEESDESDSNNDSPPKKRKKTDKVKGFNDNEVRRFVKSFKKFPLPLTRMEDIADDSDLSDKPMPKLMELGVHIHDLCEAATADEADSKKAASVKVGKVSVNAKKLVETENLLRPLGDAVPLDKGARLNWVLDTSVKDAHFDVDWNIEDDSRLLLGIYQYGLGSWEQVINS